MQFQSFLTESFMINAAPWEITDYSDDFKEMSYEFKIAESVYKLNLKPDVGSSALLSFTVNDSNGNPRSAFTFMKQPMRLLVTTLMIVKDYLSKNTGVMTVQLSFKQASSGLTYFFRELLPEGWRICIRKMR